jgi:hypothetical protein
MAPLMRSLLSALCVFVAASSSLPSVVGVETASEVPPAADLLRRSLDAMGGEIALQALSGVTYRTPRFLEFQSSL